MSTTAEQIHTRLTKAEVNVEDGVAVAETLAEQAGMSQETLKELVARDMSDRGEWPEDDGISGSDLASWMDFLGTEDLVWLDERITHVATYGFGNRAPGEV